MNKSVGASAALRRSSEGHAVGLIRDRITPSRQERVQCSQPLSSAFYTKTGTIWLPKGVVQLRKNKSERNTHEKWRCQCTEVKWAAVTGLIPALVPLLDDPFHI